MTKLSLTGFGLAALLCAPLAARPPAPPANVTAVDHERWDNGTRLDVSWDLSPDDATGVSHYQVYLSTDPDGSFERAGRATAGQGKLTVRSLDHAESYWFEVAAIGTDDTASAPIRTAEAVAPARQLVDGYRGWFVVMVGIFCGSVLLFIKLAKGGKPLKIRKIAGLEAVDEAVGRATEMGRSVLFIPGIQDMNDIQTIAGLNILARVAKTAAEYDAKIEVPVSRSLVMTAARETVHNSFLQAGRPDAYNDSLIYYVTDEQFGYVAYVQGMMVREKPAACFYMGCFFAESLILAETGNSIGAIQIAGTAMPAQLPFFVAACDYTLIGEEFFAASAYLTGSPEELGSLKGQDVGKVIVALGIISGVGMFTLAAIILNSWPTSPVGFWLMKVVAYLQDTMLT
ncbi:MAG: fibronectin type III domain-containing protein [Phycisphaerales bacterium]